MVAGSSGDNSVVSEYMGFVCNSTALSGWKRDSCYSFARAMGSAMTADKYNNRENMNITSLCASFWSEFAGGEEKREEKERVEREAEEKRLAEKAAEEAKQAAEAAKRAEEEREKKEAEEAKAKAEAAAKALEEKKAEAARMAEEAEQRRADAKKAAEEHARLTNVTNGTKANAPSEAKANITAQANATTANATKAKANATKAKAAEPKK